MALHPYSGPVRAIAIGLRTAHLGAMAMLVGAQHFAAPGDALRTWQLATVATGIALLATEVVHSRHWPYQGRGVAAAAHVAALVLLAAAGMERAGALAALAIGAVGSHLPKTLRKWSFRHRMVIE